MQINLNPFFFIFVFFFVCVRVSCYDVNAGKQKAEQFLRSLILHQTIRPLRRTHYVVSNTALQAIREFAFKVGIVVKIPSIY